jgi:hypothetical protein
LLRPAAASGSAFAKHPPLDRLDQNDRRLAAVFDSRFVGCVNLQVIVTAPAQAFQITVGEVFDHSQGTWVFAEKVPSDVSATFNGVLLEFAVEGGVHDVHQRPFGIFGKQWVPATAPDHLDDIPSSASEDCLELLDDFAVAAYRTIKTLQVTVDNKDQVVETFPCSQVQGT